jgi:two-component system cell cycle sensor histidine kinase/response regulator CckA
LILELLQNLALLITLAVGLQLLARHLASRPLLYKLVAGVLFGVVAVAGMMTPMRFAEGIIYDGRSIVLSLAGLFGGPLAAGIAAVIPAAYRIHLGGPGALPGVLTIVEAGALGVALHYLRQRDERWVRPVNLWAVGVLVHAVMLALQWGLLANGWEIVRQIGLPVLVLFPLGFVLIAQVMLDAERRRQADAGLREREERYRSLFEKNHAVMLLVDPHDGMIVDANAAAERFYGWPRAALTTKPMTEINTLSPGEVLAEMQRARHSQRNHFEFRHRLADGTERDVEVFSGPITVEGRELLYSIVHDVTERRRAERALRDSEARFRSLVEGAPDAIFVQTDGTFAYLNTAALRLFGATTADELLGQAVIDRFDPSIRALISERIRTLNVDKQQVPMIEERVVRLDGSLVPVEVAAVPTVFAGRDGAIVFVRDISGRKELEAQLLQAQKMEAVGRLAGGVAHDFNNMLQAILGHTELLQERMTAEHPFREPLEQIRLAAERSANLTRQLLAFARRQTIEPTVLDLNGTIADMLKMLQRMIGEDIDLLWKPAAAACTVRMDPSQLNQVLANLVVNARDAIQGVGKVTVETGHATFDAAYCAAHVGFLPGRYVLLAVSDDGVGMDRATQARLFEPFFTTKPKDKGTGLGLATVYGIVRQNDGFINVYSEPGRGTTFRVYLPAVADAAAAVVAAAAEPGTEARDGAETILLVEDEEVLLHLSTQLLQRLGYTVLPAGSPQAALALLEARAAPVDLLITDVVMPEMSGRDLYTRLSAVQPGLRCLFMSGYTENVIAHQGVLDAGVHFLQKPFALEALARKVREALGDGAVA